MTRRVILSIPFEIYHKLMTHLLPEEAEVEEAAMVFVTVAKEENILRLEYKEWYPIPEDGFLTQSMGYIELTDETRAMLIKKAHDLDAALVEFHSHPYPYDASFSWSDRIGFDEFVPHVWWRLKGKPYGAVVVAPATFDAIIWAEGPEKPQKLDELRVGDSSQYPTNKTLKYWGKDNGYGKIR